MAWRRPILLLGMIIALAGCERACGTAHDVTETVGERLISVELEKKLGAEMAEELRREVRFVDDPVVQRYVEELGSRLAAHTAGVPEGMELRFRVIDAPDVANAMAMPGGYIYVFSGLLNAVESEAELAGVLAHEIAHVAERHVVAQLVTSLGIHAIRALALGDETDQLTHVITEFATQGALGSFSRTAEREADELGVKTLVRAGWDPRGYAAFFDKLAEARAEPGLLDQFASTHPDPAERAERARELIAELDTVPTHTGEGDLRRITSRLARR